jgi:hypothetical protein
MYIMLSKMLGTLPPAARRFLPLMSYLTESGPGLSEVGLKRRCGTRLSETPDFRPFAVSLNLVRARRMFR